MTFDSSRRRVLTGLSTIPLFHLAGCASTAIDAGTSARFAALERDLDGRLGVFALDAGSGKTIGYRQDERFALLSTFKPIAAAAILARAAVEPEFLQTRVRYTKADLVTYSPVTEKHLDDGMTLEDICAAAVIHSDNAAGNLMLRQIGGPEGLTRYARSLGDGKFRLDRWETELNSAIEGDPRDTTTPAAMAATLRTLVLGNALPPRERQRLTGWLIACATGAARIRAGVPSHWKVGEKTGTGGFGSGNDVGVIWPESRAPIVLSIYTVRKGKDSKARNDILAAATRIVVDSL